MAFQSAPAYDPRLVFRTPGVPALRIAAGVAYLERRGATCGPGDLEEGGHECIGLLSPDTDRPSPWRYLVADGGWATRAMTGGAVVNGSDAGLAATLTGSGSRSRPTTCSVKRWPLANSSRHCPSTAMIAHRW